MVGLKLDSGVAEKLIEKTNELFYIYDDFKELSKLEMENSYILFFDDDNIHKCPANERLGLKLSYEYNGDPRLSLVQLTERGNRTVKEARIGPEGWFAIGDDLGADRVRRLELFRNPLVTTKPVPNNN